VSFKDEVNDAISQVVAIRVLIQSSRPFRPGEKLDEEKEAKKNERLAEAKTKLKGLPNEKIDSLIALSRESMPMEVDELVHKLERVEFLLEDVAKGKDRKSNLKNLVETFKTAPVLQNSLQGIESLKRLMGDIP
jgi:hypothetical protein